MRIVALAIQVVFHFGFIQWPNSHSGTWAASRRKKKTWACIWIFEHLGIVYSALYSVECCHPWGRICIFSKSLDPMRF